MNIANADDNKYTRNTNKSISDLASDVKELADNYTDMLSPYAREQVKSNLNNIVRLYKQHGIIEYPNNSNLVCLSNGSGYERFQIYDRRNGKGIGGWASKESCEWSKNNLVRDYLCISNGSAYERFTLHQLRGSKNIGTQTSKESCKSALDDVKRGDLICISNGSSYERFQIYDIRRNTSIGNWTSLESCRAAL